MSVIYFLLPLAALLVAGAVIAFVMAARDGQFDDLDTPPLRILFDDESKPDSRASGTRAKETLS